MYIYGLSLGSQRIQIMESLIKLCIVSRDAIFSESELDGIIVDKKKKDWK